MQNAKQKRQNATGQKQRSTTKERTSALS
jgi:hypothetical protein